MIAFDKRREEEPALHYLRIYDDLWQDSLFKNCTPYEQLVFLRLCNSWRGRGQSVESLTAPYSLFPWSSRTIARAFKGLLAKGIIEVVEPGGLRGLAENPQGKATTYKLTPRYQKLARFGRKNVRDFHDQKKFRTLRSKAKKAQVLYPVKRKERPIGLPGKAKRATKGGPIALPGKDFYTSSMPGAIPPPDSTCLKKKRLEGLTQHVG